MKLLIWGVSNVGKTTIGERLAKKLGCIFFDIDEEIIKEYGSIDLFQEKYPINLDRYNIKKSIMLNIINSNDSFVMAVSPIYSKNIISSILETNTVSVEIIDTPEAIYNRLIIDGDDALEYKEKHRKSYLKEIKYDQEVSYNEFADIPKIDITNQNIDLATETVYNYLKDKNIIK